MRKRTYCNHVNQHYYDASWKDSERDVLPYDTLWDANNGVADDIEVYLRGGRGL